MGDDYINIKYGNFKGVPLNLEKTKLDALYNVIIDKDYWQYYPQASTNISNLKMTFVHFLNHENILYLSGIKDGDIVFSCGTWNSGENIEELKKQLIKNKTIVIFQPDNGKYQKRTITPTKVLSNDDIKSLHFHNMMLSTTEKANFNQ